MPESRFTIYSWLMLTLSLLFIQFNLTQACDFDWMQELNEFINNNSKLVKQTLDVQVYYQQQQQSNIVTYQVEILKRSGTHNDQSQQIILYFKDQSQICENNDLRFYNALFEANYQTPYVYCLNGFLILIFRLSKEVKFMQTLFYNSQLNIMVLENNIQSIGKQAIQDIIQTELISIFENTNQIEAILTHQNIYEYLKCQISKISNNQINIQNKNQGLKFRMLGGPPGSKCNISNCAQCSGAGPQTICTNCNQNFALDSNTSCTACGAGQFFQSTSSACGQCSANCKTCTSSSSCSLCNVNYELNSSNNCQSCQINNGQYYDSKNQKCGNCPSNCLTCNSSTNCSVCQSGYQLNSQKNGCQACLINQGQYYDSTKQTCGQCPSQCLTCKSSQDCSLCSQNYQLNSSNNGCQACQINQGQFYDSSTKTCISCYQNCLQCTSQLTCQLCIKGYYPNTSQCSTCNNSCLTCNGPSSNNCLSCNSGYYLYTNTSMCQQTCNTQGGYFANQNQCSPCDQTCSTCNGSSSTQCITCANGLYKFGGDNLCKTCPTTSAQINISNCQNFSQQCLYNNQTQNYELIPVCSVCNQGYTLVSNVCVDSCSKITPNYQYNAITNQCQCSPNYPYKHIRKDNTIFCSSQQQQGFYCDVNKICNQCNQSNCQTCPDQNTCSLCSSGYYLWLNQCVQICPSSQNLQISSSKTQCECTQNYTFISPDNICVIKLSITQINLSKDSQYNIITVVFNRVPYPNEVNGISIQLDPGKLILNADYQIVSQQLVSNSFIFDVSVEQNRRVNQIVVSYNNQQTIFQLQNAILTTSNYNNSQQSVQGKIDSATNASKALTSGQGNGQSVILILKQFQILCFLSNFIQLFGPLILFKNYLPQIVYVGTILASSFIFTSIPDANQLDASSQSDSASSGSASSKQQLLQDLGLQANLYYAYPIPNISLIISIIIVLLCCFARWIMKGKQYTMEIVNFLINVASSVHQGFITPSLFSIYYCLAYTQDKYYAIIQLIIHAAFFILIYCFSFKKDVNYIESYLPNFALNINTKAKGWNTYLFASYIKKYAVILLILTIPTHPYVCCILLSITFGCFGLYILYFRFFNSKFINFYKIIQEFVICITIILLVICIKKQQDILNQDVISDDDLKSIDKFSLIVIIMLATCLIMSFILFLVRLVIQLIEIFKKVKNYFTKKSDKEQLTESFDQILEQFNSSKQKSVFFNKVQIRRESIGLKEKPQKMDLEL